MATGLSNLALPLLNLSSIRSWDREEVDLWNREHREQALITCIFAILSEKPPLSCCWHSQTQPTEQGQKGEEGKERRGEAEPLSRGRGERQTCSPTVEVNADTGTALAVPGAVGVPGQKAVWLRLIAAAVSQGQLEHL